jgi:hypothetical protein
MAFTLTAEGVAVTTGNKIRVVIPFNGAMIVAVEADAGGAGGGAGNTDIDVEINGTSIFTATGILRLASASVGAFTMSAGGLGNVQNVRAGDVLTIDVDAIPAATGHTGIGITISFGGVG